MLRDHSASIANVVAQRMKTEIRGYAPIPEEMLRNQNRQTVEHVVAMMNESDFSVAREYFEQLTDRRIQAGMSTPDFLRGFDLMVSVVIEHIERAYAADLEYRDKALRLFHAGTVFARNVVGRTHLRQVIEQGKPPTR